MSENPRFCVVAGEASGDQLGGRLLAAIKDRVPNAEFFGMGGAQMQAEGLEPWFDMDELAVMGLSDVLVRLPRLLAIRKHLAEAIIEAKPHAFIGIDAPEFNLGLEVNLRRKGIRTVQYVSPTIWAWRKGRIRTVQAGVDHMLAILPFEETLYARHDVPCTFVGHPLADSVPLEVDVKAARDELDLSYDEPVLAMLPGSRRGELAHMVPLFLRAARILMEHIPSLKIIVPLPSKALQEEFERIRQSMKSPVTPLLTRGNAHTVLAAADSALVTSGTATLEAMLYKTPMVVAYRWSKLNHAVFSPWISVPHIALPNLLAGERLVPEFVQGQAVPGAVARAVEHQLQATDAKAYLKERFTELHRVLKQDASSQAADTVLKVAGLSGEG